MHKTLLLIKAKYGEMGPGEKKIADWILSYPKEIISLSISDFADKCKSSEATIVRFSRRLGLKGYGNL